jgi:hypothetical protein
MWVKKLNNLDLGAGNSMTSKGLFAALDECDYAVFGSVNSKVFAHFGAFAWELGHADLSKDNLANSNFLATTALNTKSLAGAVSGIFSGTARFNV